MSYRKNIERNLYKPHKAPATLTAPSFTIPHLPESIEFTIPKLCASIARCGHSSKASKEILKAQAKATEEFLKIFVCPKSKDFNITSEAETLIDAHLVSIAHDIGAGIAHLYMEEMGYSWKASGAEVLSGKKKKPDYIYDNGAASNDVVAMESKGSVARKTSQKTVMDRAEKGYKNQLSPWLGKATTHGSKVAHGYAIGTWSPLGKTIAKVGVHETSWPEKNGDSKPFYAEELAHLDPGVALSNYISNFDLLGSTILASELQFFQEYKKPWFERYETEEFLEIPILGRPFLVSIPRFKFLLQRPKHDYQILDIPDIRSYLYMPTFALDLSVAKSFTKHIWDHPKRIDIPCINRGTIMDIQGADEVAVFRDGLAVISPGYIKPDSEGRIFQWNRRRGLHPIANL